MQRDIIIKGRSLGGSSDLTLLAPIKPGFIESLEAVTYKTRTKRVLETLHGARVAAHEYQTAQLLSDAVERVSVIHSVRVAVLEPEDNVLLAVTFEGSWESYIRVLWDKVGSLLDLIFCGTVGYVTAYNHSFDQWHEWARSVQVETGFQYGPPEATARDSFFYERLGRLRVRGGSASQVPGNELDEVRAVLPSAEGLVDALTGNRVATEFGNPDVKLVEDLRMVRERIRNGMQGLAALYRLADLHLPKTGDGEVLRRASIDLLLEFVEMHDAHLITDQLREEQLRFPRQLAWLFPKGDAPVLAARPNKPPPAETTQLEAAALPDIQGGIVQTYEEITHGALLMLAFDSPLTAYAFLTWLAPRITRADSPHTAAPNLVFCNIGLTLAGLRAAGLDEDSLELFPEEFRQGMAARAGLLGDVRNNHPRRWRLPRRFDPTVMGPVAGNEKTIDIETVHAVLQLRCGVADTDAAALAATELSDPNHPLRPFVAAMVTANPKLCILASQSLRRYYRDIPGRGPTIVEHFGFADGNGQPDLHIENVAPVTPRFDYNRIHPGELILGHANAADPAIDFRNPTVPETVKARMRWLFNGSFLVMRKYRQHVDAFEAAVDATAREMAPILGIDIDECRGIVRAKLMGRTTDGIPLAPGAPLNNFLYKGDTQGIHCPLHAHIRRAHPRASRDEMVRAPRLMRRSMSYGLSRNASGASRDDERGLVFMAYNASIGEQFEVVQRWLAGGNSTGAASAEGCPIVGVPQNGVPRHFRFEQSGHVFHVQLEPTPTLFEEPQVLTRLEWGLYLFTPSLSALRQLQTVATKAAQQGQGCPVPWHLDKGRQLIAAIQALEAAQGKAVAAKAWKSLIEDPEAIDRLDSAAAWAAIRADHGGVMKTPYGTLVASPELAARVYLNADNRYSVCGQFERMKRSFGEISLGMDETNPAYHAQSDQINAAIMLLDEKETFHTAFDAAKEKLDKIRDEAIKQSQDSLDRRFQVGVEVREVVDEVLAALCEAWFGLQHDPRPKPAAGAPPLEKRLNKGSTDWAWKRGEPPLYPGHFTAMSRYMFQPHPEQTVVDFGETYGQALRDAMRAFVADHRAAGTTPTRPQQQGAAPLNAPISAAIFGHPQFGYDDDFVARNMVGVLMGFNPTIIGAVLNVVRELQRDDSFIALRAELAGRTDFDTAKNVLDGAIRNAARMRPMPQIGWRTALEAHRLGAGAGAGNSVDVAIDDKLIIGIVSGTQQSLADGLPEDQHRLMFGGNRKLDPHPTHACPGYPAALGAMLGTLAAMLSRTETMRAGAAPLTFLLEGDTPSSAHAPAAQAQALAPAPAPAPRSVVQTLAPVPANRLITAPFSVASVTSGLVLAWGDSWLDYRFLTAAVGQDLRDCLQTDFRYLAPSDFCNWNTWPKAATMAGDTARFCAFLREQVQTSSQPLRAVLLSAGGNDSTQDALRNMLLRNPHAAPGHPASMFDGARLALHIGGLRRSYDTIVAAIDAELIQAGLQAVPIMVHGYDHPFPAGKQGIRKWLYDPFTDAGYLLDSSDADKQAAAEAMAYLIDQLNAMLIDLQNTSRQDAGGKRMVRYVNLRGTILATFPDDPRRGWANDLHPVDASFKNMASRINDAIQAQNPLTGGP